ncbi:DUF4249 family protein [Fulvivirgaceae bacterium PWU4]|uniref:DUF4249 family protein n=1 Tax=Chryseosolibacter histidini TaxID=2782349 RepID=A0AAP2GP25_9BACT|nr:DUF4249 domain-containing protein [Chryseosolibacter histidini]MBT1697465.1 DUF4249 family protein [Chryseosolibacter histidini]
MRYFIITIFAALTLMGCDEPIQLDIDQTPEHIVIEGLVTDIPGRQSVKITRSVGFYDKGKTPRITDALVTVKDDLGEVVTFVHNPRNHADSAGIYIPQSKFTGKVGRTYTLTVDADGQRYEATDLLASVIVMDSLKYQIDEDQEEDPEDEGKIYELLMFAKEPQNQLNWYLFKFYRNDSLTYFNDTDIYYTDDEFLAENISGAESPVYYGKNDVAKVEVYSLSRVGYVFYNDLSTLLNNDGGGMFGPLPSSPRTNLSNGALGFFQVSSVNTSTIKIE